MGLVPCAEGINCSPSEQDGGKPADDVFENITRYGKMDVI